jgi:toxin ParE1/3/4
VRAVRWASVAAEDLRELVSFLAVESPHSATTLLDRVDSAVRQLETHPESGHLVPELERYGVTRYRELVLSPWRLFYRSDEATIFIVAIIDGRRDVQDVLLRRVTRVDQRDR